MPERIVIVINVISPDDFATCPQCGEVLDLVEDDENEFGVIYAGTCDEHGKHLFRIEDDGAEDIE